MSAGGVCLLHRNNECLTAANRNTYLLFSARLWLSWLLENNRAARVGAVVNSPEERKILKLKLQPWGKGSPIQRKQTNTHIQTQTCLWKAQRILKEKFHWLTALAWHDMLEQWDVAGFSDGVGRFSTTTKHTFPMPCGRCFLCAIDLHILHTIM